MSHPSPQPGLPRPHVVDRMDRHPKQRRLIEVVDLHRDGHLPRSHRLQDPLAVLPAQGPQQELSTVLRHHQMAGRREDRAVDHQQVAIHHAIAAEPVTGDAHVEGGDRPGRQQRIEIEIAAVGAAEGDGEIKGDVVEHRRRADRTGVLVGAGRPGRRGGGSGLARRQAPPARCPRGDRDALVQQHLPLADGIARSFCRRYGDLVELDDLRQEARLELVRAAARCCGDRPGPFLQRCVAGALRHHIRDRALLVRLPAKRRDAAPWRHVTLDAPAPGEEESRLEQLAVLLGQLSPLQRSVLRLTVLKASRCGRQRSGWAWRRPRCSNSWLPRHPISFRGGDGFAGVSGVSAIYQISYFGGCAS